MIFRTPLTALCLIPALLLAPVARPARSLTSEAKARAEAKALEAKFKFKAEDYAGAATLFLQAFAVSRSPALLYNAARAFEEAKKLKQARAAFEQYLSLPNVTAAGRRDAKRKITALTSRIQAAKKAERTPPSDAAAQPKTTTPNKATPRPAQAKVQPQQHTAPGGKSAHNSATGVATSGEPRKAPSNTLNYVLMGAGGLTAVVGLLGMAGSAALQSDLNNNTDWATPTARDDYLAASEEARASWIGGLLLAAAGAGVATWGVWRWRRNRKQAAKVVWMPSVLTTSAGAPSAPGLLVGGRF